MGLRPGSRRKSVSCSPDRVRNCRRIVGGHHLVDGDPLFRTDCPLTQIDVEANAKAWVLKSVGGGGNRGRPAHHQARAGDDAVLMRFRHATIDPGALAEIIGIHDEHPTRRLQRVLGRSHKPARSSMLSSTRSAAKYCSAISRAAWAWLV